MMNPKDDALPLDTRSDFTTAERGMGTHCARKYSPAGTTGFRYGNLSHTITQRMKS